MPFVKSSILIATKSFTLSHSGGWPRSCTEGEHTFDYERYEVDLTEMTIVYEISLDCDPAKTGTAVMTDEESSRVLSALGELEPRIEESCWSDYGEAILLIPGCVGYPSEASGSLCRFSGEPFVPFIPLSDFDALERLLREISLADHSATENASCPPGCTIITARPITDCVEPPRDPVPEDWKVACECGGEYGRRKTLQCRLRLSDNSAWYFTAGDLAYPEAWGECTEEQISASSVSCDFRDCEQPPPTTCGSVGWCDTVDCGGLQYDQRGCSRKSCDNDSDCKDDERCVAIYCLDSTECDNFEPDHCICISLETCIPGSACNPVSVVGPRGEWERIEVIQKGVCAPDLNCDSKWTVFPDGQIDYDKTGVTGTAIMNPNEIWTLDHPLSPLIDGPELRVALRDGIECGFPLDGASVSVRLVLDGQTLEREISDCILGPEGNVFLRVYDLVTAY